MRIRNISTREMVMYRLSIHHLNAQLLKQYDDYFAYQITKSVNLSIVQIFEIKEKCNLDFHSSYSSLFLLLPLTTKKSICMR